jgi:hypothetical protein
VDYSPIAGININQTLMAVIAVASAAVLIIRHLGKKNAEEPQVQE